MDIPCIIYPLNSWWAFGLFSLGDLYEAPSFLSIDWQLLFAEYPSGLRMRRGARVGFVQGENIAAFTRERVGVKV